MTISKETQVCVIGAGPAGLMSAIFAAQSGAKVVIIEKNSVAGKKLLLTAGDKCESPELPYLSNDRLLKIHSGLGRDSS
jgi:predicted flavoprotein YhiN